MQYNSDRELLLFNIKMVLELFKKSPEAETEEDELKLQLTGLYTLRDSFNETIHKIEGYLN